MFFVGVGLMSHNDLTDVDPMAQGWPVSVAEDHFKASEASIAVDTASPRTYNFVNDRRGGDILSKQQIRVKRGSGGVQIGVKCGMLPCASDCSVLSGDMESHCLASRRTILWT
jgi:hypothetical protein